MVAKPTDDIPSGTLCGPSSKGEGDSPVDELPDPPGRQVFDQREGQGLEQHGRVGVALEGEYFQQLELHQYEIQFQISDLRFKIKDLRLKRFDFLDVDFRF